MSEIHETLLDRWLVASEPAFRALLNHWRGEAGSGSLLDWRLQHGLIEAVAMEEVEARIKVLTGQGSTSVSLIVETMEPTLLEDLEYLAPTAAIRLFEWHQSPLAAVLAANGPDRALLSVLEGRGAYEGRAEFIPERSVYEAALAQWERGCRNTGVDAFAQAYPLAGPAIAWGALIGGQSTANDNDWIPIPLLAAGTPRGHDEGVVLEDPEHEPALWDITLAPIDGGPRALLRFRAVGSSPAEFVGKRVRVQSQGSVIDLGTVDETGRASVVLQAPLDISDMSISIVGE